MKIIIVGAGQNGTQVYHILKHNPTIQIAGFLDDNKNKRGTIHCGKPVLGEIMLLSQIRKEYGITGGIVAIGNNYLRMQYTEKLKNEGLNIINAIHPSAVIDDTAVLEEGVIIEMGVMIHPEAYIGRCVFVGGSTVIAHHCKVGDSVLLGGGVIFGGQVSIGEYSLIGVGSVLQPGISIGKNVTLGIGSAVVKNLPDNVVALGIPAKVIRNVDPL